MTTPTAARAPVPRLSMLMAIVLFFALAIGGLFYVKWSPYYAKVFVAARDHTLGASIISGNLPADQNRESVWSSVYIAWMRFIRSDRRSLQ